MFLPLQVGEAFEPTSQQRPTPRRPEPRPLAPQPADEVRAGLTERCHGHVAYGYVSAALSCPAAEAWPCLLLRRCWQPLKPARPRQRRPAAKRPATFRQQQQAAGQPGSVNSLGGPQLTRRLQDAEPSQQVVALVQQAGPQCNAFHFTTAVNRVAKLHDRQPKASIHAAFAALLAFAEQHPAIVDHVAVAQTMWAGGVLRHRLTAQQQAAWQVRLVWTFAHPELLPKQLANGLWGWSRMGLPLQGQQAAAADAAIQRVAGQMESQNVANTLLAFANASWQLSSAAAAALLQQL